MLVPFNDPTVAVVYGRQIPQINAPIDERARLIRRFGDEALSSGPGASQKRIPLSNACAALRRERWEEFPYDETCEGGEEWAWTENILTRGYRCWYWPKARVFHSHHDSIRRFVWREWELHETLLVASRKRSTLFAAVHRSLAMAKRRVSNCIFVRGELWAKFVGLLRLPLEMFLFFVVSLISKNRSWRASMRPMFWQ
jgi:GT2 family glycosyltransferase